MSHGQDSDVMRTDERAHSKQLQTVLYEEPKRQAEKLAFDAERRPRSREERASKHG